jgi:hypothetical protein
MFSARSVVFLAAVTGTTLSGIAFIHHTQRVEREVCRNTSQKKLFFLKKVFGNQLKLASY